MRKLLVSNLMSLDGYYEGPGKDVFALFGHRNAAYPDDWSFDEYNIERLRAADILLLGKNTFEGFRGYWPSVVNDLAQHETQREISRLNNAIEKVVISNTLKPVETHPWDNTRIVPRQEAVSTIADLKRQEGKDILVFGSRTMWNSLLEAGLVDELHLMISPVVVSGGTPIFADVATRDLVLVETRGWYGSGLILAIYRPLNA